MDANDRRQRFHTRLTSLCRRVGDNGGETSDRSLSSTRKILKLFGEGFLNEGFQFLPKIGKNVIPLEMFYVFTTGATPVAEPRLVLR